MEEMHEEEVDEQLSRNKKKSKEKRRNLMVKS
jgi:hypothetical protein